MAHLTRLIGGFRALLRRSRAEETALSLLAAWIPASRAARVDPVAALKV